MILNASCVLTDCHHQHSQQPLIVTQCTNDDFICPTNNCEQGACTPEELDGIFEPDAIFLQGPELNIYSSATKQHLTALCQLWPNRQEQLFCLQCKLQRKRTSFSNAECDSIHRWERASPDEFLDDEYDAAARWRSDLAINALTRLHRPKPTTSISGLRKCRLKVSWGFLETPNKVASPKKEDWIENWNKSR